MVCFIVLVLVNGLMVIFSNIPEQSNNAYPLVKDSAYTPQNFDDHDMLYYHISDNIFSAFLFFGFNSKDFLYALIAFSLSPNSKRQSP